MNLGNGYTEALCNYIKELTNDRAREDEGLEKARGDCSRVEAQKDPKAVR